MGEARQSVHMSALRLPKPWPEIGCEGEQTARVPSMRARPSAPASTPTAKSERSIANRPHPSPSRGLREELAGA